MQRGVLLLGDGELGEVVSLIEDFGSQHQLSKELWWYWQFHDILPGCRSRMLASNDVGDRHCSYGKGASLAIPVVLQLQHGLPVVWPCQSPVEPAIECNDHTKNTVALHDRCSALIHH